MPSDPSTGTHRRAIYAWRWVGGVLLFSLLALPALTALPVFLALPVLARPARAQEIQSPQTPWVGWVGPWADGIMGFRFGMDPSSVRKVASGKKLHPLTARSGTLRYGGKLAGREGEIVLEFSTPKEGPQRGELSRILFKWDSMSGVSSHATRLFELLDKLLAKRYGSPVFRRQPALSEISTGYKQAVRVYQGPEMQARLILMAASNDLLRVNLILVSPQLHPGF